MKRRHAYGSSLFALGVAISVHSNRVFISVDYASNSTVPARMGAALNTHPINDFNDLTEILLGPGCLSIVVGLIGIGFQQETSVTVTPSI